MPAGQRLTGSDEVGITGDEVHANLLLQDKVDAVRRLEARGRKVLVTDRPEHAGPGQRWSEPCGCGGSSLAPGACEQQ